MTVLVGIRARGAVLFATDGRTSRETGDGVEILDDDVQKLVAFPRGGSVVALFSGRASINNRPPHVLVDLLSDQMEGGGELVLGQDAVLRVGRVLRDYFEGLLEGVPARANLEFVVAGFAPESQIPEAFFFSVGAVGSEHPIELVRSGYFLKGSPETSVTDPAFAGESVAERLLIDAINASLPEAPDLAAASELALAAIAEAEQAFGSVGGTVRMWVLRPDEPVTEMPLPG